MDGGGYFVCVRSFQFIDGIFKCRRIRGQEMGSGQFGILMEKSEKIWNARLRNSICGWLQPKPKAIAKYVLVMRAWRIESHELMRMHSRWPSMQCMRRTHHTISSHGVSGAADTSMPHNGVTIIPLGVMATLDMMTMDSLFFACRPHARKFLTTFSANIPSHCLSCDANLFSVNYHSILGEAMLPMAA